MMQIKIKPQLIDSLQSWYFSLWVLFFVIVPAKELIKKSENGNIEKKKRYLAEK